MPQGLLPRMRPTTGNGMVWQRRLENKTVNPRRWVVDGKGEEKKKKKKTREGQNRAAEGTRISYQTLHLLLVERTRRLRRRSGRRHGRGTWDGVIGPRTKVGKRRDERKIVDCSVGMGMWSCDGGGRSEDGRAPWCGR